MKRFGNYLHSEENEVQSCCYFCLFFLNDFFMRNVLMAIQMVVAIILSIVILLQSKGVGLSDAFGGDGNVYSTKRGAEKFLHIATIVLAVALVANTIAFAFLAN